MVFVALALILLHGIDGREIRVLPEQITSLQSSRPNADKDEKLYPEGLHCLVNLADGKSIPVVEPCTEIQKMLEGSK